MTTVFAEPANQKQALSVREAGGDNIVPRAEDGRPKVRVPCWPCNVTGRVPSEKREGKTVQCPKCKGKREVERTYSRVTSYIDVLEDKSNIQAWSERNVLIGVAMDTGLLKGVLDGDPEEKDHKDWLNRRAKVAKNKAGAEKKADRGTYLHALSEKVDDGEELPDDASFEDVIDMDAYARETTGFEIVHMEKLIVIDERKVAGTPDRVSKWACYTEVPQHGYEFEAGEYDDLELEREYVPLIAPDGSEIGPDDLIITDLKTGTMDYGQLKMAMQLAIYSRGELYDPRPEDVLDCRTPMLNVRQDWGIIMNVAAGSGECELYWADLTMGWRAVGVAGEVRALRNEGKKALTQFAKLKLRDQLASAA